MLARKEWLNGKDPLCQSDWAPEQWDTWDPDNLPDGIKTGPGHSGAGRTVVWDVEADGILRAQGKLPAATQLWCMGCKDVETGEKFYWGVDQGPKSLEQGLRFVAECSIVLAHNGIGMDYPLCEELYPWWQRPARSWDTMVLAKLIWPYDILIGPDLQRIRQGTMPGHMMKRQALAAWGYRLGTFKTDYQGKFHEWCPAMATYLMGGDMDVPDKLWRLAEKRMGWARTDAGLPSADLVYSEELTVQIEMDYARILWEQEDRGVRFDREKAIALAAHLTNEKARIEKALVATFGSWWQPLDDPETGYSPPISRSVKLIGERDVVIKRVSEKTGKPLKDYVGPPFEHYTKGCPYVRVERTTFNPSSRDHLGQRLQVVFGWRPKAFGKDGKPTVDESTLAEIPDAVMPEATRQLILDYFVVTKTLGMVSKGARAWLHMSAEDGRIHGRVDPAGAITRRCTHNSPNLSQVPGVKKEKVVQEDGSKIEVPLHGLAGRYGIECRELLTADEGEEQTGIDASSLELIVLGHYLEPLDGGQFRDRVCDPSRDPHAEHAELAGGITRQDAKTTIYLIVFGGSAWKLSLDRGIVVGFERIPELLGYRGLPMLLKGLERRFDADFVAKLDDMQKARLAYSRQVIVKLKAGIEGLDDLIKDIQAAGARGYLKALDGSKLHVRKAHAALNTALQGGGAIICRVWKVLLHRRLKALGLRDGVDFKQILDVHDEVQFSHRPGLGPTIIRAAEAAIVQTGELLGLRGRLRSDGKTGRNWAECH